MIAIVAGIAPSAISWSSRPFTCVQALIESPRPCSR